MKIPTFSKVKRNREKKNRKERVKWRVGERVRKR